MTKIRGVVDMRRDTITPESMEPEVDHYSIPALDANGRPETTASDEIDSHKLLLRGGEVVTSRLNPRKSRVHIVPERLPRQSVASTEFVALRPVEIDRTYLAYLLQSERTRQDLDGLTRSATRSHQRVEPFEILNIEVPIGGSEEQRRIADFLDDRVARIDQIIAARQQQIAGLSQAADALWSDFTTSLNAPWVPLRRFLRSIVDGPFGSSLKSEHYTDHGTRVIRLGNIGIAQFREGDAAYIDDDYAAVLQQHAAIPGDLIMAGLGDERWPLGRCAVVPDDLGPAIVKADCYRIRLDERIQHDFAASVLSAPPSRGELALLSRGATRARLNTEVAREARLPVISLDEQRAYTGEVRRLHEDETGSRHALTEQVALLQEYKQALITAAVTGEFDVTTAAPIPE